MAVGCTPFRLSSSKEYWHSGKDVLLRQVEFTIRLGRGLEINQISNFIKEIITEDWLSMQYSRSSRGTIANVLFLLWSRHERFIQDVFCTKALRDRSRLEVRNFTSTCGAHNKKQIRIIGMLGLIGLTDLYEGVNALTQNKLDVSISMLTHNNIENYNTDKVTEFWVGVYELVRQNNQDLSIDSEIGTLLLDLWRSSERETIKHQLLIEMLIAWFERCQSSGWKLVRDTKPIQDQLLAFEIN
ncbi:MAG: hypothetical protein NUV44_10585 [Candidatus Scalindua sp.]|nr:hypothetical protein [Candidatus Scalindua sp.]